MMRISGANKILVEEFVPALPVSNHPLCRLMYYHYSMLMHLHHFVSKPVHCPPSICRW